MVRTTYFKIRITPAEEKSLKEQAADAHCTLSQLIRRKLGLDNTPAPAPAIRLKAIRAEQAARRAGSPLCVRCVRIGVPSCPTCLKAAIG